MMLGNQFPDLSPIKNLWRKLQLFSCQAAKKASFCEEWAKIPPDIYIYWCCSIASVINDTNILTYKGSLRRREQCVMVYEWIINLHH